MNKRRTTNEQAKYWLDPALGNLEMLRASFVTHAFAPHAHDGFAIGVIEAGAETFQYRGELRVAPAGSLVLINPGEMHTGEALNDAGWRYRMLYPSAEWMQLAASELAGKHVCVPFFAQPVANDAQVARLLLSLHASLEGESAQLERESRLLWTLAQLVARHADLRPAIHPLRPEHDAARRIRNHLQQHLAENVTLDDLSRLVNMSAYHLLRVFRETAGLPPHSYLTQLRVARAKVLLAEGMPIAEVSTNVGFTDQSHLNRHFKRIVGVTPGQFVAGADSTQHRNFIQDTHRNMH